MLMRKPTISRCALVPSRLGSVAIADGIVSEGATSGAGVVQVTYREYLAGDLTLAVS